jgi:hypothetical protein
MGRSARIIGCAHGMAAGFGQHRTSRGRSVEVAVLKLLERRHLIARWHDGFKALIWLYVVDESMPGRELVYDIVSVQEWGTRPPAPNTSAEAVAGPAAAIASVEIVLE